MRKLHEFIATGLYVGYFPTAPGTFGSLTAVIIAFLLHLTTGFPLYLKISVILVTTIIGLISTADLLKDLREKDPGFIIIDEWAGQFVTFLFVPISFENLAMGFIFFRFFDILKIFPVNRAERLRGAYGVMTDDLIAGFYAAGCLYLWHLFV